MTVTVEGLGPLVDLATAIGLVADDHLDTNWFIDPAGHVGNMLRVPAQRDALLRALNQLVEQGAPPTIDDAGRNWVRVFREPPLSVYVVIGAVGGATELGHGVRIETDDPRSTTEVYVPLLRIPASGPVAIAFTDGSARVSLESEVTINPAPPAPAEAGLEGIRLSASVATDNGAPTLAVTLVGLQLPGQTAPADVSLGGSIDELEEQAIRLLFGLLQSTIAGAAGDLAELLALIGITDDARIPTLPVADILSTGAAAWQGWLEDLISDATAFSAWLDHVAQLAPPGAHVDLPAAANLPARVEFSLANGIDIAVVALVGRAPDGSLFVELGAEASLGTAGPPAGSIELTITLARITLGATPTVTGLPLVELAARLGPAQIAVPDDRLLHPPDPAPKVGSFRVGLTLDASRRVAFVLAAHDVIIGAHSYPLLDLTNTQTLAEVAGNAVSDLADTILAQLGAAEQPVRVLSGLSAPAGQAAWPTPLTAFSSLLADPVGAIVGYHSRVLSTNRAGYAAVLDVLRGLLAPAGFVQPITGAGAEADPWRLEVAAGISVVVWTTATTVELAVAADQSMADIGGGCPRVTVSITARMVSIALDGSGGHAVPGVVGQVVFGARGGVPLRLGDATAAIIADSAGLEIRWDRDSGIASSILVPALRAVVDGEEVAVTIPTIAANGAFEGEVPWRALELLFGHVIDLIGTSWSSTVTRVLGWVPGAAASTGRLPLEQLVADPAATLKLWAEARIRLGDLAEIVRIVSFAITGPAADLGAGIFHGNGLPSSPFAIPIVGTSVSAAVRVELQLWAAGLTAGVLRALPSSDDLAASATRVAGALQSAESISRTLSDLFIDRSDFASGMEALAARWADSDGLVSADNAVFSGAGAIAHDLPGVSQSDFPTSDLGVVGVGADSLTIFVVSSIGPEAWRGVPADHVLDLRAAGLTPESFDLSQVTSTDGPWLVRLSTRADSAVTPTDDGAARQIARLARVVDAVATRDVDGDGVTIVALGAAGHAAVAAASRPGVRRVITLGTPHGGIDLSVLEAQPAAGALQLLAALTEDDGATPSEAFERGRSLLGSLLAAYDAPAAALADLVPPPVAPTVPAGVEIHCMRGRHDEASVAEAIGALVARTIARESTPAAAAEAVSALGTGLTVTVEPPAAAGELHVKVELTLTGTLLSDGAKPGLRVRIGLGRVGGWLAGGPDPLRPVDVSRHPSLRRADIEIDLFLDGTATAQLVFQEANALGVSRRTWLVNQSDIDTLLPEARVLVGRMAAGLGAVPASGLVRQLATLLDAIGLVDAGSGVVTGQALALSVDGIRRLVVDPVGLFVDAVSAAKVGRLASALAALIGAPAPAASTPSAVDVTIDGVTVRVDLAARTMRASATALACPSGISLGGELALASDGTLSPSINLAFGNGSGPNGRAIVELTTLPALEVKLRWEGAGSAFPANIELYPAPDTAALAQFLVSTIPATVLWAGISFVRAQQPGAVALIDPMLRAVGLLDGTGDEAEVVLPVALLGDPAHWLQHAAVLGDASGSVSIDRIRGIVDVFAAILGLPQPSGSGTWQLPFGLELAARTDAGRPTVALSLDDPVANTGLRAGGSIALALPSGSLPASPSATLLLALPGAAAMTTASRIAITVDASGFSVRLILPASNIDARLLPNGEGLTALGAAAAAAAVTYALPLVLDAIVNVDPAHPAHVAGLALAAVGDALALRSGGHFDAAEIQALAAHPAAELARRLANDLPAAIDALAALVDTALPADYAIARDGNDLFFHYTGAGAPFEVRVTVPVGAVSGARLTTSIGNVSPFAGATLSAGLTVDSTGLVDAHASFAIDPAHPIAVGDISLAPLAQVAIGSGPAGGARLSAGLAIDAARSVSGVLRFGPPVSFALEPTGGTLEELLALLVLPPAFDLALALPPVTTLLDQEVLGGATLQQLLEGVVFAGNHFDPGVLNTTQLWSRLLRLAANVASKTPALPIDDLTLAIAERDSAGDQIYGVSVTLAPGKRFRLVDADTTVDLEIDASWITSAGNEGLTIELLRMHANQPQPFFGIAVRGLGVRIAKSQGPLLDTFVALDSVALHGLVAVDVGAVTDGGGQIELGNFHIALGSSDDSDNQVASGILKDSASGNQKPEPKFSPALALQKHGAGALEFDLRAGEGNGPWWITIQRSFGPVYIEQVGFGVDRSGQEVVAARVIVDGKVSLLDLTVAVDDLSVGARWPQHAGDPPLYDPAAWSIDLMGLGVAAATSAVSISGGLSRSPGPLPDYLGMVSIRFSVYGISAYGGYAVVTDAQGQFTSLFIYGAVNAPIGGPPAFFVTGIGAGVGVNRRLLLPADLNEFPEYPLLKALDRNSSMADPEQALDQLRAYFPSSRGAFWFAAGISFNSFTLIDGIAVVAVAIADGVEISLLGLARAGLPNPSFPLVQIELALVARFTSKDPVLWVQAQLTDNSFLLTRDCRLTGGFAYVMWFSGDKAGEFVLTLGGYHPSFHRDGYPIVPRLGFVWNVADYLVIKGESYFALTSEAIMAGTRFEASLTLGPLWAYLRLGADGIVYFDPFHFEVTAYAELGAGVTIDIDLGWFGHVRITVSVQLHADVLLEGPEFRGKATIDLDVTSATISFGDWSDRSTAVLAWPAFEEKYVRPGGANVLTVVPGRGTLPPSTDGDKKAPTGGVQDPYLVLPEFTLSITTTAATTVVKADGARNPTVPVVLAIGPMQLASVRSVLAITLVVGGVDRVGDFAPTPTLAKFPKGVWGPQPQGEPKPVPKGETVDAINGATLASVANISPGTVPIEAHQVEIGPRLHLPFLIERAARAALAADAAAAAAIVDGAPVAVGAVLDTAQDWHMQGGKGSAFTPLGRATFRRERSAPPQLVPLAFRLAIDPPGRIDVGQRPRPPVSGGVDFFAHAPTLHTILTGATPTIADEPPARTIVGDVGANVTRVTPRRPSEVQAALNPRLSARLVTSAPSAKRQGATIVAADRAAKSGRAGAASELRRRPGLQQWRTQRLDAVSAALVRDGADLIPGELAVFTAANAHYDIKDDRPSLALSAGAPARVVTLDTAGNVTYDATVQNTAVPLPRQTDRIVVLAGGSANGSRAVGWHAGSRLAQVGVRTLVGAGCSLITSGVVTRRGGTRVATGWVVAADAVRGFSVVTTRLPANVRAVAIVLEPSARIDDERGDLLELGISGARRTTNAGGHPVPPLMVAAQGRRISVYAIEPNPDAAAIEVTIASGEHVSLGGVIGSRQDAAAFADSVGRRDLSSIVGALVDPVRGKVRVRWTPQQRDDRTEPDHG